MLVLKYSESCRPKLLQWLKYGYGKWERGKQLVACSLTA